MREQDSANLTENLICILGVIQNVPAVHKVKGMIIEGQLLCADRRYRGDTLPSKGLDRLIEVNEWIDHVNLGAKN